MFACQECGTKFKKVVSKCRKCGNTDIDLAETRSKANKPRYDREQREMEGMARRASNMGSDFLDHDHSMNY